MNMETWQQYAQCWSAPEVERVALLPDRVSEAVLYRDPNAEVEGVAALQAYMAGFQQTFPGHRFEIRKVVAHHDRSVAWWQHLDPQGQTLHHGVSFAAHDGQGRLRDITGFFDVGATP